MGVTIRAISADDVRDFASWRYGPPYDVYNLEMPVEEAIGYFLAPDTRGHALVGDDGELEGFCTFGSDARVPGGRYAAPALDIGLGIRPDRTGMGRGRRYVQAVVRFAVETFRDERLRVTIAAWNERARRVWSNAGFRETQRFAATRGAMSGQTFIVLAAEASALATRGESASRPDRPGSSSAAALWSEFAASRSIEDGYTAWAFGPGDDPDLATELAMLVLEGRKRATTSLLAEYEAEDEPLPRAGQYSVVLDGGGDAVCIIRTTTVEIRAFGDVDARFARDEGEGDRSLEFWRRVHREAFGRDGVEIDDQTPVVLERFELVWPLRRRADV